MQYSFAYASSEKTIVDTARHKVTTAIPSTFMFGGCSRFEVTPGGGASAGPLRMIS